MPALHVLWAFPCKKQLAGKHVKLPVFTGCLRRFLLHLDLLKEANKNNTHTYIYSYINSYIGSPFLVDFGTGKIPSLSFTKSTSC